MSNSRPWQASPTAFSLKFCSAYSIVMSMPGRKLIGCDHIDIEGVNIPHPAPPEVHICAPSKCPSSMTHLWSCQFTAGSIFFAPSRSIRFVVAFLPSSTPDLASHMPPEHVAKNTFVCWAASFKNNKLSSATADGSGPPIRMISRSRGALAYVWVGFTYISGLVQAGSSEEAM